VVGFRRIDKNGSFIGFVRMFCGFVFQ